MKYQINTAKLVTDQNYLAQEQQRVSNASSNFYAGAFNTTGNLSSALLRIKTTFVNVSKNLESIKLYLKDYVEDIESYENAMSGNGGYVKIGDASSAIRSNQGLSKGKSFSYEMDGSTLFKINKPVSRNPSSQNNPNVPGGVNQGQAPTGDSSSFQESVSPENPNGSLDMGIPSSDFDMNLFDFNLDIFNDLNGFEVGSFDVSDIFANLNFDLSSIGGLTMGAIGSISAIDIGNIGSLDIGNISGLGEIGALNISSIGNLNIPNMSFSEQLIIKDLLDIKGIDISGLTVGDLSSINIGDIQISDLNLNLDTLKMLEQQIQVGAISELDAINALHRLFPNTNSMSLEELMKMYQLNLSTKGLGDMSSLDANLLNTGAFKGIKVNSALSLGFGILGGGLGAGALAMRGGMGGSKNLKANSVSSNSSKSNSPHKNAFAGFGDALAHGGIFGATVMADANIANEMTHQNSEVVESSHQEEVTNPLLPYLMVDVKTIEQDVFYRLKKFNMVKKMSNYIELIQDANDMNYLPSKVKLEERIAFLIPSVLPSLLKNTYLYHEMYQQSLLPRNKENYQQLYAVINNHEENRFKWLNLQQISNNFILSFRSQLNVIDQTVNCGTVCVSKSFSNVFALIQSHITEVVDCYEHVYRVEVPKVFHSDKVLDENSTPYDKLYEKMESLSVQAVLNGAFLEEAKRYLSTIIQDMKIPSNLYCFQEMIRNSHSNQETIFLIRIGTGIYPYRYYASYPGVGLKEINPFDVKLLMNAGFRLREE